MEKRRRTDGEAWIAVELRVPWWAVWCLVGGMLLLGASAAGGVTALLLAAR